jgi:hypothetical protein
MSKTAGKSEMKESNRILRDNVARLEAIGVPTIEAQKIALETPELVGLLEAEQLGPSAVENIAFDPRLREAQLSALDDMRGLSETGLGAEDLAALDQIKRSSLGQAEAQKQSVLADAAARGMMDSGSALAAQLSAGQAAADRVSQQGMQQAAQAAQARRAAIGDVANMASRASAEDLGLKTQQASARDTIAQFNAQNRQGVNASNLASRQSIENQRAGNVNQAEMYNKGLIQQKFQNEMSKATGVTGANSNLAGNLQNQASAAQQAQQAQTSAILNAGTSIASAGLKGGFGGAGAAPTPSGKGGVAVPGSFDEDYMKRGR